MEHSRSFMAEKAIFEVRTLSELHAKEGSMGVQNTARVSRHRKPVSYTHLTLPTMAVV